MSKARDTLDRTFSRYIRLRDCPNGSGQCISCGRPITFSTCDAGHFIGRSHMATRYNTQNVNAQCLLCNRMKDGNLDGYRRGLAEKYGSQVIGQLEEKGRRSVHLSENDYNTLNAFFKNLIERL